MIISDVKGVCSDKIVPLQDLHVVHFEFGAQTVGGASPTDDPISNQPSRAQKKEIAKLKMDNETI